ncbi:DUF397 domain-containing protein [Streptomyces sp. NPDC060194]|uniref:DUF397 domain-containing protein n=1 Tax=Streptomyces sp. NPDC060194 TaxID=3347069 RepID=UPI0036460CC6
MAIQQGGTDRWTKSSYSAANGACVEVMSPVRDIAVRDSKVVSGPAISFESGSWNAFVTQVGRGSFDIG